MLSFCWGVNIAEYLKIVSPSNYCLKHQDHWVRWYLITTQNYTDYTPGTGFSVRAGSWLNLLAISRGLSADFSLEITPPKNQNLMMSVFSSNTLIFAAKRWKCILRVPDFKIFPGGMPLNTPSNLHLWCLQVVPMVRVSSFSGYYKAFATYLKPYWKPCRLMKVVTFNPDSFFTIG